MEEERFANRKSRLQVAIVGMGSLGMLYAAKLCRHASVSCICVTRRSKQAAALNQDHLIEVDGQNHQIVFVRAVSIEDWDGEADWNILAVKQNHLQEVLLALKRKHNHAKRWLLMQNGLGHVEKVLSLFPSATIACAVSTEGARRLADTSFAHTGHGTTRLGLVTEEGTSAETELRMLAKWWQQAGLDVTVVCDILPRMWEKWLINCAINPITGILEITNGQLLQITPLQDLFTRILEEGLTLTRARGAQLTSDVSHLSQRVTEIALATSQNHSSMLQDIEKGQETEIEALNGLLVRWAEEAEIPVPTNQTIYQLLLAKTAVKLSTPDRT